MCVCKHSSVLQWSRNPRIQISYVECVVLVSELLLIKVLNVKIVGINAKINLSCFLFKINSSGIFLCFKTLYVYRGPASVPERK